MESQLKSRMQRREKTKYILSFLAGDNKDRLDQISTMQVESSKDDYDGKPSMSNFDILGACKELVFNIKDGKPVFHAIMYAIDTDKVTIKLEHTLDVLVNSEESKEDTESDIRNTLALAAAQDVPVYPNTRDLAPILEKHHRNMLIEGFTAPDGDGERVRLKLTKSIANQIEDPNILNNLDLTGHHSPADLALIKSVVTKELLRLQNAQLLLSSLELAIQTLEGLLSVEERNENSIQRCLTENPILFGTDYARIVAKPKLGSEYEPDYALQKYSGEYDLVEIESSSLPLYTKAGNPSQYLVHAEQQVLDWLHWIERNNPYAREGLPELISPVGYVIIGRKGSLTESDQHRLLRRNSVYRGQLVVMTYDDLLVKANNLLAQLQKLSCEENA